MAMIKGEPVTLYEHTESGTDALGVPVPVYDEAAAVTVDNVLIAPVAGDAVVSTNTLHGRHEACTLYVPKGDTHVWEGGEVEFWGKRWQVYGAPLRYPPHLVPAALDWNLTVQVERYE
jgi:uncharacterized RmlC-like cupin family protein